LVLPSVVFLIIIFGFTKKVRLFDTFIEGAKDGIKSTLLIIPPLVGLIVSINMIKSSGALDMFTSALAPLANMMGIPDKTIPLVLLRPISGSGSMAIINNLFSQFGPDSFVGKVASTMMGSTETTFYAIAVYYGSINIKNTRHTVPAALCADLTGFLISVLSVKLLFFG
jgi:spore maturation protein B